METVVLPHIQTFNPEAVFIQGGVDALADDPQSRLKLSNQALWRAIFDVKHQANRLIVSGGGGYNPFSVARAWAGVWATLSGQDIPDRLPPPVEALLRKVAWQPRGPNDKRDFLVYIID